MVESTNLTIGKLAKHTGSTVQTLRHYEKIGLIGDVQRTEGNHRVYGEDEVERIKFILHARSLGFSLEAIRDLLELADTPSMSCDAATKIAQTHLDAVVLRLNKLQSLKAELEQIVRSCKGRNVGECSILKSLADHGKCINDDHGTPETFTSS